MEADVPAAVPVDRFDPPAAAVLVNFGLIAGRDPTREETEQLARSLHEHLHAGSVIVEQRYEVGQQLDIRLHGVRIEVPHEAAESLGGGAPLRDWLIQTATRWVEDCAKSPGTTTLAERLAREAVVGGEDAPREDRA